MINPDTIRKKGQLSVGTYGWDYAEWVGTYYPEELPEDWRLAYYSNDFRSVLTPANHWQTKPKKSLQEIAEEIDNDFSLVLELPSQGISKLGLPKEQFINLLGGFGNNLVALCWRPVNGVAPKVELQWFRCLAAAFPTVLDYAADAPDRSELDRLGAECEASRLWRPQRGDAIPESDGFLMAVVEHPDLVYLRTTLEMLGTRLADGNDCGFFLEASADAPRLAKQCRILVDLLEI